jgi:hypothetical protein
MAAVGVRIHGIKERGKRVSKNLVDMAFSFLQACT